MNNYEYVIEMPASNGPCWICDVEGDPGRTCVFESAKRYSTKREAWAAEAQFRRNYPNREYRIREVKASPAEAKRYSCVIEMLRDNGIDESVINQVEHAIESSKPWRVNVPLDTVTRLTERNRKLEAALRWIEKLACEPQGKGWNLGGLHGSLMEIETKCHEVLMEKE